MTFSNERIYKKINKRKIINKKSVNCIIIYVLLEFPGIVPCHNSENRDDKNNKRESNYSPENN